ncbi:hypothetical protein [uncultured Marivirga sp.]|uniref:hypothetical protein n=1 Tax=uncultured Marivirga sp. TaxID=1123707 RepID=UPI0030EB235B|tara:strand:+ start:6294 stop:6893 length:600 start_codon:yes stop_codon:yes gene_type:complete
MKNIPIIALMVLMLSSVFSAVAQSEYQNGYIVTNQNDTIYGQLQDRSPEPFGKIYNKVKMKGYWIFNKKYGPKDIVFYQIGDLSYESIWYDSYTELFTVFHRSVPGQGKKVFMRLSVNGQVKLYWDEYRDPDSGYELEIPFLRKANSTEMVRVTQGIFGFKKKHLANLFSDCSELVEKMNDGYFEIPEEMADFYNQECY